MLPLRIDPNLSNRRYNLLFQQLSIALLDLFQFLFVVEEFPSKFFYLIALLFA